MDSDKPSLPFSQRILTQESIFVTIVAVAWLGWFDAFALWIGILRPPGHFFPHDALIFGFVITLALTISISRGGLRTRLSKLVTAFYIVGANALLFHGGGVVNIFYPMSLTPVIIISTLLGIRRGILYAVAQGAVFVLAILPTLENDIPDGLAKAYGIAFSDFFWYIIAAILFGILGLAVRGLDASRKEIEGKNEELFRLRLRQERQQIARDVHSSAIQKLYVAQMKVEQAAKSMAGANRDKMDKDSLENVKKLLADTTRLVKEAVSQLRTLVLERHAWQGNEGFVALLEAAAKEVYSMSGQTTQLRISPSVYQADRVGDFSPEIVTGALEITKEAIINAVKHAEASQLQVTASIQDRMLRIVIQDNGKGFTVKNLFTFTMRRNFGLYDMRQRCQELGGKFRVSSEPGQGTCVDVLLPLSRPHTEHPSRRHTSTP
ncbi:MAG: sensor histidine kinase [Syntrophothermus sp.]